MTQLIYFVQHNYSPKSVKHPKYKVIDICIFRICDVWLLFIFTDKTSFNWIRLNSVSMPDIYSDQREDLTWVNFLLFFYILCNC